MIRVFIADDHALIRGGMRQILATADDMELVGEVAHGEELLECLARIEVDVLLLDLSMPGLSGPALIQAVSSRHPSVRILVVTMHKEGPVASRALQAGATGYMTKDSEPEALLAAIRKVAFGRFHVAPELAMRISSKPLTEAGDALEVISRREREVLRLIADGLSLNEIATRLCVSPKTVSTYKMRLMQKLNVDSNADLLRHAIRAGLTDD